MLIIIISNKNILGKYLSKEYFFTWNGMNSRLCVALLSHNENVNRNIINNNLLFYWIVKSDIKLPYYVSEVYLSLLLICLHFALFNISRLFYLNKEYSTQISVPQSFNILQRLLREISIICIYVRPFLFNKDGKIRMVLSKSRHSTKQSAKPVRVKKTHRYKVFIK